MSNTKKLRINELARELEVKAQTIIETLPKAGIKGKKTHSSSLDDDAAEKVRELLRRQDENEDVPEPTKAAGPETVLETPPDQAHAAAPKRAAPRRTVTTPVMAATPAIRGRAVPLRPPVQALRPPLKTERPAAPPAAPAAAATRPAKKTVPAPPPADVTAPAAPVMSAAPGQPEKLKTRVKQIPLQPAAGAAQGPRTPMQAQPRKAALPGVPIRPPVAGAASSAPRARVIPGQQKVQPAARARVRPPQAPAAPQKPVPGKPIYERARRPAAPGMPAPPPNPRFAGPRTAHPAGRGAPPPGQPGRPDSRRPQRSSQPRTIRDREAEREAKVLRRQAGPRTPVAPPKAVNTEVTVSPGTTLKELAEKLGIKANLIIKTLVDRGLFATINQTLDIEMIQDLCRHFGATATELSYEEETMLEMEGSQEAADLEERAPVVTVMGHVDHGKTSLLDAIRETNVAEREAGGITQAIGAYHVEHQGRRIVFVDTPGHEAFTRMRARGAQSTDIVILVVSADDGVMPQTIEAIDHAKAANVPIVVAINKIDIPGSNPERVKQQLADRGLLSEDWGGDVVMVPVSAAKKQNLDQLLEMVLLVADLKELKANPNQPAVGTVLEAKLDRGQGPVATVLIQNGTLRNGDYFLVGSVFGKVRAMLDERGNKVKEAPPSSAVVVLGLEGLPDPGDTLQVATDTDRAKKIAGYREDKVREQALAKSSRLSLEQFQEQLRAGDIKELPLVLKTDVQGSMEVLTDALNKLSNEKVKVQFIHTGVGAVSESDVLLATAANAIIIGFNVRPERSALTLAEREGIDLRLHTIIYELIDEIKAAMTGLLDPITKETFLGRADVLEAFRVSKVGIIAGCKVEDGRITNKAELRLLRDNIVVYTGKVSSLRRFKDEVSEVRAGQECGVGIQNFNDVKKGDVIEAFTSEKVAQQVFV